MAGVTFDKSGNLYGTTWMGGFNNKWGVLYQLSPPPSGDQWTENTLYKFVGNGGGQPLSVVGFDDAGNAYVTASAGASNSPGGCGGIFSLFPILELVGENSPICFCLMTLDVILLRAFL